MIEAPEAPSATTPKPPCPVEMWAEETVAELPAALHGDRLGPWLWAACAVAIAATGVLVMSFSRADLSSADRREVSSDSSLSAGAPPNGVEACPVTPMVDAEDATDPARSLERQRLVAVAQYLLEKGAGRSYASVDLNAQLSDGQELVTPRFQQVLATCQVRVNPDAKVWVNDDWGNPSKRKTALVVAVRKTPEADGNYLTRIIYGSADTDDMKMSMSTVRSRASWYDQGVDVSACLPKASAITTDAGNGRLP